MKEKIFYKTVALISAFCLLSISFISILSIYSPAVSIVPPNDPPIAEDDSYIISEDSTLNISSPGILGNDYDPDGDVINISYWTEPSNGSLLLNFDGSFIYIPDSNFFGKDSFDYQITDGTDSSELAKVLITVNSVDDAPVAIEDTYSMDEDHVLSVIAPGVIENDYDIDDNWSDPEIDSPYVILESDVSFGSIDLKLNGSFTYKPNENFFGQDSFVYRLYSRDLSDTANVSIKVNSVNDPPIAVDDEVSTQEDTPITIEVLTNDYDIEGNSISIQSISTIDNGSLTINTNESISFYPDTNFVGTTHFNYTISDDLGGIDVGKCVIHVIDNTPPETTINIDGELGNMGWFLSNVSVKLNAQDRDSKINYTEYRIDDGIWLIYENPFEYSKEGISSIEFRSVDNIGNLESIKYEKLKIDKTSPLTELLISESQKEDGTIYVTYDSEFFINATDSISGVNASFYSINGTEYTTYNGAFQLNGEPGYYMIFFYSIDNAGNKETINKIQVILVEISEEQFQGYALVNYENKLIFGSALLSLSQDSIRLEVSHLNLHWDIIKRNIVGKFEFIVGEGNLGKLHIIIYRGHECSYLLAYGKNAFFIGYS